MTRAFILFILIFITVIIFGMTLTRAHYLQAQLDIAHQKENTKNLEATHKATIEKVIKEKEHELIALREQLEKENDDLRERLINDRLPICTTNTVLNTTNTQSDIPARIPCKLHPTTAKELSTLAKDADKVAIALKMCQHYVRTIQPQGEK